jgi:hypothetical protein
LADRKRQFPAQLFPNFHPPRGISLFSTPSQSSLLYTCPSRDKTKPRRQERRGIEAGRQTLGTIPHLSSAATRLHFSLLRACTVVFNVKALKVFKGVICKKILELSLREETPLARKPSSNRRLTSHCTNLSSVLSI